MKLRFSKRRKHCMAIFVALPMILTACGGGGSSASIPVAVPANPTPEPAPVSTPIFTTSTGKAPGVTYSAVGEGTIGTASLLFDVDGGFKFDGVVYTLQYSGSAGTCGFAGGTDVSVCSPLASGRAFLLCDDSAGAGFQSVLLSPDMAVAGVSELAGSTLTGISCGANGEVRSTGRTLSFNADASIATQVDAGNTSIYGTGVPASLASAQGSQDTGPSLHRWAIYKQTTAGETTYLLFDLHQLLDDKIPDMPAYAYRLKKTV